MVLDSFISGLEALSEHRNYLSFFGDAAQFERRDFHSSSPHKSDAKMFVIEGEALLAGLE